MLPRKKISPFFLPQSSILIDHSWRALPGFPPFLSPLRRIRPTSPTAGPLLSSTMRPQERSRRRRLPPSPLAGAAFSPSGGLLSGGFHRGSPPETWGSARSGSRLFPPTTCSSPALAKVPIPLEIQLLPFQISSKFSEILWISIPFRFFCVSVCSFIYLMTCSYYPADENWFLEIAFCLCSSERLY